MSSMETNRPNLSLPTGEKLVVISGPSGVGKTTVADRILNMGLPLRRVVTTTTRPPRPGETPGIDYHFFSRPQFDEGIASDAFLEWAEVHGNRYGTRLASVQEAARDGSGVLLVIDVQGARQVRERLPGTHSVFILPPSEEILIQRILARKTETEETLKRRLESARQEIPQASLYDYCVVNEDLDRTVTQLSSHLKRVLGLE